jgi:hypothetical protein
LCGYLDSANILASGQPSEARGVLKIKTMLDVLESLFDIPARVIQIGEIAGIDIE